jgi:hypothetical protein
MMSASPPRALLRRYTGIAGFRADLALIDDPVRSRADAESPTVRDKQWDWYKSDLIPRTEARSCDRAR